MEQLKRLASAVVILPPLLLFLYYAPPVLFFILVLVLATLSLEEYWAVVALPPGSSWVRTGYGAVFLLVCAAFFGGERWVARAMFLGFVALTVSVGFWRPDPRRFLTLAETLFGVLFIGWGLSHLILLRSYTAGKWYIFFLCALVWGGDSMAMYMGKCLGRHKMAPAISPAKTWEGAVAEELAGMFVSVLVAPLLVPGLAWWQSVVLGLVVTLAAQIGDLGESMIKRYAGVKDSGNRIPGHGGVLDRIDSMLFAAPTLVYALDFLLREYSP